MKTKPVLIIAPTEWGAQICGDAVMAGYLPIKGDDFCATHILEDRNVYKANQRAEIATQILAGMVANPGTRPARELDGSVPVSFLNTLAVQALALTDALIAELKKPVS